MPKNVTESTVEDAALHWFEGMGYSILHGPDIAPVSLAQSGPTSPRSCWPIA